MPGVHPGPGQGVGGWRPGTRADQGQECLVRQHRFRALADDHPAGRDGPRPGPGGRGCVRMPGATAYTTRYNRAAKGMTAAGVLTAALAGRRWRAAAATAGALLLAGSAATRFAIFHAGVGSAE